MALVAGSVFLICCGQPTTHRPIASTNTFGNECIVSLYNTKTGTAVYGRYGYVGQTGEAETRDRGTNYVSTIRCVSFASNRFTMEYSRRTLVKGITNSMYTTNFYVSVGMTNTNSLPDGTAIFARIE